MAAGKTNFNVCAENKQRNHVEENDIEQHHKLNVDSKVPKDPLKNKPHFTIFDGCLVLLSLITYLVDTWTDIVVCSQYFLNRDYHWGCLTLAFIVLPSIVIQVFSARWYAIDNVWNGCYMYTIHVLQIQPLERYVKVLHSGWLARRSGKASDIELCFHQQNDVCMLRLFESFLESAPQLCLQLYIIIYTSDASWLTGISASISLLSLGWSVAVYSKALRQAHVKDYLVFWPALCLQTAWHMSIVASRVLAIVIFASVYKAWTFVFLTGHWVLMTLWITYQDTDFCPGWWEERFFNCIVGVIYSFCFFNVKEGRTRHRMLAFYGILLLENAALTGSWFPFGAEDSWFTYLVLIIIFGGFFIGILCMLIYYRFCHPTGPISMCCSDKLDKDTTDASIRQVSSNNSFTQCVPIQRKILLKSHSSRLVTASSAAETEYHLVSGKVSEPQNSVDEDTSTYHHYTIDASMFLQTMSANHSMNTPHPSRKLSTKNRDLTSTPYLNHNRIAVSNVQGLADIENPDINAPDQADDNPRSYCPHEDSVVAARIYDYDEINCSVNTANFPIEILMDSHERNVDITHLTLDRTHNNQQSNHDIGSCHVYEDGTDC